MAGFAACALLEGVLGDRYARVVILRRQKNPPCVPTAVIAVATATTSAPNGCAISRWLTGGFTWSSSAGASTVRGALACT